MFAGFVQINVSIPLAASILLFSANEEEIHFYRKSQQTSLE